MRPEWRHDGVTVTLNAIDEFVNCLRRNTHSRAPGYVAEFQNLFRVIHNDVRERRQFEESTRLARVIPYNATTRLTFNDRVAVRTVEIT